MWFALLREGLGVVSLSTLILPIGPVRWQTPQKGVLIFMRGHPKGKPIKKQKNAYRRPKTQIELYTILLSPCFRVEAGKGGVGESPALRRSLWKKSKNHGRKLWRFWRYNGSNKPISWIPRFRYVGLATVQNRQNFFMQGVKGGDFLSAAIRRAKNTTRTLHEEKPFELRRECFLYKSEINAYISMIFGVLGT